MTYLAMGFLVMGKRMKAFVLTLYSIQYNGLKPVNGSIDKPQWLESEVILSCGPRCNLAVHQGERERNLPV